MKHRPIILVCMVVSVLAGCSRQPSKEDAEAMGYRAEALVGDAKFAMEIREYSRAEELIRRALKLRDDVPEYWVSLGMVLRRQDDKNGARNAYEKALGLHADHYEAEKTPEGLASQAFVLALLGRTDEALALLRTGLEKYPDSAVMKEMAAPTGLPRTFRTEAFRELML